jgi:hypothetical protein
MNELFNSIHAKFNSSVDLKNAVSGRFSYGRARNNSKYPYIVYSSYTSTDEDTFTAKIKDVPIQINIFSDDKSHHSCFDLLKQCETLFKNAVLTVENHEDVTLTKDFEIPPIYDGKVWLAVIEFSCLLQAE